jgi:hypothetical protein
MDHNTPEAARRSAAGALRGMLHVVNVDIPEESLPTELFQRALSHFVSIVGPLRPKALFAAADALLTFPAAQAFRASTEMQLDSVSFAVFLIGHGDPEISAKGRELLKAVANLADLRNNVDVLVATSSAFALFPGP